MSRFKIPKVLKNRSLLLFLLARIAITLAFQMITVAIGWQIYALTKSTFYLGLVGLVQFLPMFVLTLLVGYVADNFNRKLVICLSLTIESVGVLLLGLGSLNGWINKDGILIIIFFIAVANSFQGPPMQAILPNIVSKELFPEAAAWSASANQFAVIVGPALGGIFYAFGANIVYFMSCSLIIISVSFIFFISVTRGQVHTSAISLDTIFAGIKFIKSNPIILGSISLDLFAVLFGGATALLPVYASTILKVGPSGLGLLRSAPAVGALLMSVLLARRPLKRKVGLTMFIAVLFFGFSTILFSISTSFKLSLIILAVLGASDVISVVIRATLIQLNTPDEMRGRVSSVNLMFIGTSNQLGEFESGITASLFGTQLAVFIGGLGTIIVVLTWMKLFPKLLHVDNFGYADK